MKKPQVDLPIELAGKIIIPMEYEFLCQVWNDVPEKREILIKSGVATNEGMKERKLISTFDGHQAVADIGKIDIVTPAIEIGYVTKDYAKD